MLLLKAQFYTAHFMCQENDWSFPDINTYSTDSLDESTDTQSKETIKVETCDSTLQQTLSGPSVNSWMF